MAHTRCKHNVFSRPYVWLRAGRWCMFFAAGLLMSGCQKPETKMKLFTGNGFLLSLPNDVFVSEESPLEDFELHTLTRNKEILLKLYAGNQPDFPSEEINGLVERSTTIHGLSARDVTSVLDGGLRDREVLVDLSGVNEWPQYLHFSYSSLNPEVTRIADQIIESVNARPDTD